MDGRRFSRVLMRTSLLPSAIAVIALGLLVLASPLSLVAQVDAALSPPTAPAGARVAVNPVAEIRVLASGPGEVLHFEFGWNGIVAGHLAMQTQREKISDRWHYRYTGLAQTRPQLSWAYKLTDRFDAVIDAQSLEPRLYMRRQNENSRASETVVMSDGLRFKGTRTTPESTKEFDIARESSSYDPISVAYIARSIPLALGETYTYYTYDGRNHFRVSFYVEGRETIKVAAGIFDSFRVKPHVENLTDPTAPKKVRASTVWISADRHQVPVRIESDVWLGKVFGELVKFSPGKSVAFKQP
jgi:hypothetical protein